MKKYGKEFALLVLCVMGTTFTTMFWPKLLGSLIDIAIPQKDTGMVLSVCGIMLLLVAVGVLCGIASSRFAASISAGVGKEFRTRVFRKVSGFSMAQIDKFSPSSLITRTNNDIAQVQTFLNMCLDIALTAPIMCFIGIILSVITSPSLSVVLVIAIPIMALVMFLIGRRVLPLFSEIQEKTDLINLVIREKLTGARVIRAFGTTKFEDEKFAKINDANRRLNKRAQRIVNMVMPLMIVTLALTAAAVMWLAVHKHLNGTASFTTGDVMAVVSYVVEIMAGVIMLTIVFVMLPRATASAKRVEEILVSENEINDPATPKGLSDLHGYLEFRDVSFAYKGSDTPALKHLTFKAGPGETTAIIGGTGMGKTTIINLIPRLYDVTEGQVLVDGIDVRDYDLQVLRSKIGFVPQKAVLFSGTIDSNVGFGKHGAKEEEIEEAVTVAQSYDFVSAKEGGFSSHVAQGGSNFSGGQKQRLAIARGIVSKPEIYVFDDSFSALDFKTDKALRTALKGQTGNATVVIVAQRISTIMDADRIIVIDAGDIVGIGTHSELLKSCDVYREIAVSQLGKEAASNG